MEPTLMLMIEDAIRIALTTWQTRKQVYSEEKVAILEEPNEDNETIFHVRYGNQFVKIEILDGNWALESESEGEVSQTWLEIAAGARPFIPRKEPKIVNLPSRKPQNPGSST